LINYGTRAEVEPVLPELGLEQPELETLAFGPRALAKGLLQARFLGVSERTVVDSNQLQPQSVKGLGVF
jgi:hypothetical protein